MPVADETRRQSEYGSIAEPLRAERPTTQDILTKTRSHPLQVIKTWSPEEFELFVHEWAYSCLKGQYQKVIWAAGAGDKGRDIRAYVKDEAGAWDNYQCKRYATGLTPTEAWPELAKLCYYSHLGPRKGGYRKPRKLVFVAQHGVGPTLADLIESPEVLREELCKNWSKYCEAKLGPKPVKLSGALKTFVTRFDFKIVTHKTPREMIEDIEKTRFYSWFFGLKKFDRSNPPIIPEQPDSRETEYVSALQAAYADHIALNPSYFSDECSEHHEELKLHYREARECFYTVEDILRIGRDSFPRDMGRDLLEQMFYGVRSTVRGTHASGYARVVAVEEKANSVQMGGNDLAPDLTVKDRCGLCHHLANEGRIAWALLKGKSS